jgi:hypothetical protein
MEHPPSIHDDKSIHSIDLENNVSLPPQRPPPPMHLNPNFKISSSNSSVSTNSQSKYKNIIRSNSIELEEMPKKSSDDYLKDRLSHSTSLGSLESHKFEENKKDQISVASQGRQSNIHSYKGDSEKMKVFSNEILSSIESIEKATLAKKDDSQKHADFSINDYLNRYSFSSIDDETNDNTIQKTNNLESDDLTRYKSESMESKNEIERKDEKDEKLSLKSDKKSDENA